MGKAILKISKVWLKNFKIHYFDVFMQKMLFNSEQPVSKLSIWVSREIYFGREPQEDWGGGELGRACRHG